jgi:hypothetical protein
MSGMSGLEALGTVGTLEKKAVRQGGLSSARDRARLREREAAERVRVERVLARGPRYAERRRADRDSAPATGSVPTSACGVCGSGEVLEDEVGEGFRLGQGLRLAWCRRCDHRWTERLAVRFVPRFRRPSSGREGRDAEPVRRANGA